MSMLSLLDRHAGCGCGCQTAPFASRHVLMLDGLKEAFPFSPLFPQPSIQAAFAELHPLKKLSVSGPGGYAIVWCLIVLIYGATQGAQAFCLLLSGSGAVDRTIISYDTILQYITLHYTIFFTLYYGDYFVFLGSRSALQFLFAAGSCQAKFLGPVTCDNVFPCCIAIRGSECAGASTIPESLAHSCHALIHACLDSPYLLARDVLRAGMLCWQYSDELGCLYTEVRVGRRFP